MSGRITLSDVLRLALPLDTALLGSGDRNRVANWVSVVAGGDSLADQVRAGDIAILPAQLQSGLDQIAIAEALEELAEVSVAALLVFEPVSDFVSQRASRLGLPILAVTGKTNLRDVHQDIASLLLDRQKQVGERGMQLYRRLSELSREGGGLEAMTDVMSRLSGKAVAVQDKRLEIRALQLPEDSQLDMAVLRKALLSRENLPRELRDRKKAAVTGQSHWQQLLLIDGKQMARLISPIISGDRARGYVSVVGAPDELDVLDATTAEQGAAACALEMAKAKAISETKKALRGSFLDGLLAGTLPEHEIERLASRLDHDTGHPHAVLALSWAGSNSPSLRRLETPLNWLLSSHNWPALTHVHGQDHLGVFLPLGARTEDLTAIEDFARRLREHLGAEFPNAQLLCGLSGPVANLIDWPEAHRQAVRAMRMGARLGLDRVVDFNRLGVYQLLMQIEDQPAVKSFCQEMIGPLDAYDSEHKSSLVQTLAAYFDHHGNISATADSLFIHRNTLLYRLERIQELTELDMGQADMRLALHLGLLLWQTRSENTA